MNGILLAILFSVPIFILLLRFLLNIPLLSIISTVLAIWIIGNVLYYDIKVDLAYEYDQISGWKTLETDIPFAPLSLVLYLVGVVAIQIIDLVGVFTSD